jgi:predicted methyltransferase/DNA-directed RNA polymerase subunit RPC12/RpoP
VSPDAESIADLERICHEVAQAARLQEGDLGVRRILLAVVELDKAPTRAVSARVQLPLPIVAAVLGELRRRQVLTTDRPSMLTPYGRSLLAGSTVAAPDTECLTCAGCGVVIPPQLAEVSATLADIMATAPVADLALDQSHSTIDTKLRRVAAMLHHQILPTRSILLVGDDDLMSLTLVLASQALGARLVQSIGVLDISEPVLSFIEAQNDRHGDGSIPVRLARHDLRLPLDKTWVDTFDVAVTDPPYTAEGAGLFLSRAVEGLSAGPGRDIVLSYPHKGPAEARALFERFHALALVGTAILPEFNAYHGAGVIGGTSNLYLLRSTDDTAGSKVAEYTGPLYTADKRAANRTYVCLGCRSRFDVGPGAAWKSIQALRDAGCPTCGEHRFRPLTLVQSEGDRRG